MWGVCSLFLALTDYTSVQILSFLFLRNTKQIDVFSLEKSFVRIYLHSKEHWCLAVSKLTLILELEQIIDNASHHEVRCVLSKIQ